MARSNPQDAIWPAAGKAPRRTTKQYLAAAKRKLEISSDYALAQALGVTKASMSLLANGRNVMSNTTAAKVAEILELDPLEVIADCELERGSPEELWERIRRKVIAVVPAVLVAIGGTLAIATPDAIAAGSHNQISSAQSMHCHPNNRD